MGDPDTLFKCCTKLKKTDNYFCIECCNIFHKSCTERTEFRIIERHKILCSKKCCDKFNEITDGQQKNSQSKKSRKHTQDFTDDVSDTEQGFLQQIKNKCQEISELNKEISSLNSENLKLTKEIRAITSQYKESSDKLSELDEMSRNMIHTIRTLEEENERCNEELCKLREASSGMGLDSARCESIAGKRNNDNTATKPQLLVIGARDSVIGCGKLLKKYSNSKYDINSQYKTGVMFDQIVEDALEFSRNFTKRDFVIVFVGCENAIRGKSILRDQVDKLILISKNSNLIVIGSSFACDRKVLNNFIYKDNITAQRSIQNDANHSMYLSINNFMQTYERSSDGKPSYASKVLLCKFLCSQLPYAQNSGSVLNLESNTRRVNRSAQSENNAFLVKQSTNFL